jgi:uncharacterized protein (DUF2237 family)
MDEKKEKASARTRKRREKAQDVSLCIAAKNNTEAASGNRPWDRVLCLCAGNWNSSHGHGAVPVLAQCGPE